MSNKKVKGILNKSKDYRNAHLKKGFLNYGKYSQLQEELTPAIGEQANIHIKQVKSLTNGASLLDYTHYNKSEYSDNINRNYFYGFSGKEEMSQHIVTPDDYRRKNTEKPYETLSVNNNGVVSDNLGRGTKIHHDGYSDETIPEDRLNIVARNVLEPLQTLYSGTEPYVTSVLGENGVFPVVFDGLNEYGTSSSTLVMNNDTETVFNVYGEGDVKQEAALVRNSELNEFGEYTHLMRGTNNLLSKTNKLYNNHKIGTMFGRHVSSDDNGYNMYSESFDSAKIIGIGNPRGRGLLKLGVKSGDTVPMTNGYYNPFCRSWSYHHQYMKIQNLIRPMDAEGDRDIYNINHRYRSKDSKLSSGDSYLKDNTVLMSNGFVRITPTATEMEGVTKMAKGETKDAVKYMNLKKYMLSIENLAWSDGTSNNLNNLSLEQRGPNGGRIMWFPPYDLSFSESVNVDWNPNSFIGRGEKVYTYKNTDRTGTLNFTLLIDHPAIINSVTSGSYTGKEPDLDPENDILRFFAGCGLMDPDKYLRNHITEQNLSDALGFSVTETMPTVENNDVGSEEVGTENEISFYVFFPNNYSGCWNYGYNLEEETKDEAVLNQRRMVGYLPSSYPSRSDNVNGMWYKYLLAGSGCDLYGTDGNGYEMTQGKGISDGANPELFIKHATKQGEIADWYVSDEDKAKFTEVDKYQFLVDYDLRQAMVNKASYVDSTSYQLNYTTENFSKSQSLSSNMDENLFSFAEAMYILLSIYKEDTSLFDKENLKGIRDSEKVNNKIIEMLGGEVNGGGEPINDEIEVTGINVTGFATETDKKNSEQLAYRRGMCVFSTLQNLTGFDVSGVKANGEEPNIGVTVIKTSNNINDLESKASRAAKVTIKYKTVSVDKVSVDKDLAAQNLEEKPKKKDNSAVYREVNRLTEQDLKDINSINTRYDNEYRFFSKIKEDNPFIYKKLVDKFKYFDPAFHSLSPEGFNARLTFLHQCTRQGRTVSVTETTSNAGATAGNLSFGKMPVCVLRIGDFINTRILIQSINLTYDNNGMQWDLNPEGIGVQPMYAKVQMNIVLIGGQSLEAPISRLQNAISHNYYANAPVYDDRADRATYNHDGTVKYEKIFRPQD